MRSLNFLNKKTGAALLALMVFTGTASAQMTGSVLSDTVSSQTANLRKTNNTTVNFDVAKLNSILAMCMEKGVTNVQFIFVQIRAQDTAKYFTKHKGVKAADRRSVIGKPTLLIKVPRSAFGLAFNEIAEDNTKVKHMLDNGFYLINATYTVGAPADDFLYFDSGTICPPPADCGSITIEQQ